MVGVDSGFVKRNLPTVAARALRAHGILVFGGHCANSTVLGYWKSIIDWLVDKPFQPLTLSDVSEGRIGSIPLHTGNIPRDLLGVYPDEKGSDAQHVTEITLDAASVTITDDGDGYGTLDLYTFPDGNVRIVSGSHAGLTVTAGAGGIADNAADVDVGFGTVACTGSSGAALSGTEENIIAATACTLSGGAGSPAASQTDVDTTFSNAVLRLNIAVHDAGLTASDTMTVSGTLRIHWMKL